MNPLLFNTGIPVYGNGREDFLKSLGPFEGGFRGRNNGNGYIAHASLKAIFGEVPAFDNVSNGWTETIDEDYLDYINSNYSHVIFFMQDFLSQNFSALSFENFNKFLAGLKIPVCPISLGINGIGQTAGEIINTLSESQIKFAKLLSERSETIGVRGAISFQLLSNLGIKNVKITGCPSYFENGPNRIIDCKPYINDKVITSGSFFTNRNVDSYHLLQDELFFIRPLIDINSDASEFSDLSPISQPVNLREIECQLNLYNKAINGKLLFFTNFDDWRKYYKVNDIRLTIGTRLHSAIQAINSNSLSIVTNGDLRVKEVCEYFDIPIRLDISHSDNLEDKYNEIDVNSINARYSYCYGEFQQYLKQHSLDGQYKQPVEENEDCLKGFHYPTISEASREYFAIHRSSLYQIIGKIVGKVLSAYIFATTFYCIWSELV